jgi:FkbM family methyltransferase
MMKQTLKEAAYRILEVSLGRRNVVRLGRYLSNRSRLDTPNDMRFNGELVVLDAVVRSWRPVADLVAFDVGANVGDWTRALLHRLPPGKTNIRVFAFEPVSSTRAILERDIAGLKYRARVRVVAAALSDVAGMGSMFIVGDGAGTNSLHANERPPARTEAVSTETVDGFCARESIDHVDIMKVDTEGHDLAVLDGARGMLGRAAIDVIQFEYNHRWIFARRFLYDAFRLLGPFGYRLGKVTPFGIEFYEGWHPELESFREGNYLACPESEVVRFPTIGWWNGA